METILILIVLFLLWFLQKEQIDKTNRKIDELKAELQKREQVKPEPQPTTVREEIMPEPESQPIVQPSIIDEPKEEELPPPVPKYEPLFDESPHEEEVLVVPPPLPPAPSQPKERINYEKYIGENLFGKIGILILVAGVGFFVKYAIDKDWINEVARTVMGFVCGFILLFVAERLKEKYRTFSSLLAGGSFAIFYVTVAIAYHYYQIFSQPVAFAILILTTILMTLLAIIYDRRELAIIALVGGFIAPFLVSTGQGNYKVLFTYIMILNMGMFSLSLFKKWVELPVISFAATTLILGIFTFQNSMAYPDYLNVTHPNLPLHLLIFSTCFYFIFFLPILHILKSESGDMNQVLMTLIGVNNFVYLGFGLYYLRLIDFGFKADGLLTLFIALVNGLLLLWMWKQKHSYKLLVHILLGMVIVFVTLTIPIQLNGNMVTLLWSAELVVLAWLYLKSGIRLYEYGVLALIIITFASFLSDCGAYFDSDVYSFNILITHLFVGASLLLVALFIARYRTFFDQGALLKYHPWNAILIVFSIGIFYYALAREVSSHTAGYSEWLKAMGLFTSGYLLLLVFALQKRFPLAKHPGFCMAVLFINLIIFAIDSYWVGIDPASTGTRILLSWGIALVTVTTFIEVGHQYFRSSAVAGISKTSFITYLALLSTLGWLSLENLFLNQVGIADKSAGFSIALSIAGFVMMALGMRLHIRVLRKMSLIMLGIVLVKLILIDLWAMPTLGKIIVFIFLGVLLLVLSFLYQKLKGVLFGEDEGDV